MKILVDLDDTLVNMMEKALYYFNNRFPEKLKLEDLTKWEIPFRADFEEIWRIPGFFADLPWMDPDAQGVLRVLKARGHQIVVCSAVPTWESCKDKYAWCHTNLRIPGIIDSMDDVILTRGKHHIQGDCMIDDKPANLENRRFPIIFDRPWNRNESFERRAHSWDDVYMKVLEVETQEFVTIRKYGSSFHSGGCY